jgi:hypothetical protein
VVLKEKKSDKEKVYLPDEPVVYFQFKGKKHKKILVWSKVSFVGGNTNGVIIVAYSLPKNDYDGHTLDPI